MRAGAWWGTVALVAAVWVIGFGVAILAADALPFNVDTRERTQSEDGSVQPVLDAQDVADALASETGRIAVFISAATLVGAGAGIAGAALIRRETQIRASIPTVGLVVLGLTGVAMWFISYLGYVLPNSRSTPPALSLGYVVVLPSVTASTLPIIAAIAQSLMARSGQHGESPPRQATASAGSES